MDGFINLRGEGGNSRLSEAPSSEHIRDRFPCFPVILYICNYAFFFVAWLYSISSYRNNTGNYFIEGRI